MMTPDELINLIHKDDLVTFFNFLENVSNHIPNNHKAYFSQLKHEYLAGNTNYTYTNRLITFVNATKDALINTGQLTIPRNTLESDFANVQDWVQLGINYHDKGEYSKAIKAYNKGLENTSHNTADIWYRLGITYYDLGQIPDTFRAYHNSNLADPKYYKSMDGLGWLFYSQGKYLAAIDFYQASIDVKPDNYEAWNWKGKAYSKLKQPDKAVEAFQEALNINPDYDKALYNLGWMYYSQKNYKEASNFYEKALNIDSKKYKTWNGLGLVYKSTHQNKQAIEAFHQALLVDLTFASAWHNLGIMYQIEGDYTESIFAYQKALKLKPEAIPSIVGIGWSYFLQGDLAQAKRFFEEAPNNHLCLMNLGHIALIKNDIEKAQILYTKSLNKYLKPKQFFNALEGDYVYLAKHKVSREKIDRVLDALKKHLR